MINKLDITPQTLIGDLLENYPELENKLIEIAPVFSKLKNPILRRTIAKVTTLKQASVIGSVSVAELINKLRKEVNQNEINIESESKMNIEKPSWIKKENIKFEYDATLDLENGIHPAGKVTKEILQLNDDDIYLLITPFIPAPLIKIVEENGFTVFTEKQSDTSIYNYIKKK
ncbi:DUF1858 domain-containing protein [Stygiobacter electus]|uniref:DUF1858 domain-containing protein n=1 Tax=Stygiobacter electus TaxID=3032292 RepID=A0AAE3NZI5_9BACT|nr:DUF1858 domain-containing protein [Stygiobacter electus]MDF1611594.1 DUF1858 domain-containing protein [Stygiobacter electus]